MTAYVHDLAETEPQIAGPRLTDGLPLKSVIPLTGVFRQGDTSHSAFDQSGEERRPGFAGSWWLLPRRTRRTTVGVAETSNAAAASKLVP